MDNKTKTRNIYSSTISIYILLNSVFQNSRGRLGMFHTMQRRSQRLPSWAGGEVPQLQGGGSIADSGWVIPVLNIWEVCHLHGGLRVHNRALSGNWTWWPGGDRVLPVQIGKHSRPDWGGLGVWLSCNRSSIVKFNSIGPCQFPMWVWWVRKSLPASSRQTSTKRVVKFSFLIEVFAPFPFDGWP